MPLVRVAAAETALNGMVRPRLDTSEVAPPLPAVLSSRDLDLYRRIFAADRRADWSTADQLLQRLSDRLLVGHVLAERYLHPTAYRSMYWELKAWLERYPGLPEAERIFRLAERKRSRLDAPPPLPAPAPKLEKAAYDGRDPTPAVPTRTLTVQASRQRWALIRAIDRDVDNDALTSALQRVDSSAAEYALTTAERDSWRARIAERLFELGYDERAFDNAWRAMEQSGAYLPDVSWTAGLAAWRLGRYADAATAFERLASRHDISTWQRAAAWFWAARSNLVVGHPERVTTQLRIAAQYTETFYGLLSRHILGLPAPFQWSPTDRDRNAVAHAASYPEGRRALALIALDDKATAAEELRLLAGRHPENGAHGAMIIAEQSGLAQLASWMHGRLYPGEPGYWPAAYPIPSWTPTGGFTADRALVYGLIRQESRFNPNAQSHAGARGLMQLMPATARFVARRNGYPLPYLSALNTPSTNLVIGQTYIDMLLGDGSVNGDLIRLAAAWNGGPGNLQRWLREIENQDDPLLFLETVPFSETAKFIERVLANLWIYRDRLGQRSWSLESLAAGSWPAYVPSDAPEATMTAYGRD